MKELQSYACYIATFYLSYYYYCSRRAGASGEKLSRETTGHKQ